ncbi:MAG: aminotransferase class V-fold PLP-dependent enzyme [Rhodobacteraceae bacterium]|nr:aminotransferase class V-fold PLP-dependent enzyme [Paracoccaceae bacterium]
MKDSFGRGYVAIPGPSVLPDRVLQAMMQPAPNIYSAELAEMVDGVLADLCRVARTDHHCCIYISNGHGAWEAALSNMFSRGDRILVLSTGLFAEAWGGFATAMGIEVEEISFGKSSDVDASVVFDRLEQDVERQIRAVLIVHTDTSTSVRNDVQNIGKAVSEAGHPALFAVDCIASLACDQFEMDEWGVDVVVAGSQKGLMTPPGLGFLFFNKRARETCRNANLRTPYWDWERRIDPEEFYLLFCGTAPTHHLFALREALNMLLNEEGLEAAIARHARLARACWAAIDAWSQRGDLSLNIREPCKRSHAVTTIRAGKVDGLRIRNWVEENSGVTLGIGLGMAVPPELTSSRYFRLGHMGHVNDQMIMGLLGSIECACQALGIERGDGALDVAAATLATARS